MGLNEQLVFPEINADKVHNVQGMNISVVTTAGNDDEARVLLRELGLPLRVEGADGLTPGDSRKPACRPRNRKSGMASKAKIEKAKRKPKFSSRLEHRCAPVRPAARRLPQVQALPDLLPQAVPRGSRPRRKESELVIRDDRSDCRHAHPRPQRRADRASARRHALLEDQGRISPRVLKREGYIWDYEVVEQPSRRTCCESISSTAPTANG